MVHQGPEHHFCITLAHLALVDDPCINLKPLETPGKSRSLRPRSLDNLDFLRLPVVSRGLQAGECRWFEITDSHEVNITQGKPTNDQGLVVCLAGLIFSFRFNHTWEF